MNRKFHSVAAILRYVTGKFSGAGRVSSDGTIDAAIRLVQDYEPENDNPDQVIPTLHSLTDASVQAIRVVFVEGPLYGTSIYLNGAGLYFGPNDNYKMWCDTDNVMKLGIRVGVSSVYTTILEFPNFSTAWTQTTAGTAKNFGEDGALYIGLYNKWKIGYADGTLNMWVNNSIEYYKMIDWSGNSDAGAVVDYSTELNTGSVYFGATNNYKLYVSINGRLKLVQKSLPDSDTYDQTCFELGI